MASFSQQVIEGIDDLGYSIRSYSGRGMCGRGCCGVVVPNLMTGAVYIGTALEKRAKMMQSSKQDTIIWE